MPTMPPTAHAPTVTTTDWRLGLPTLRAGDATLRELRVSDAAALLASISTADVTRFISPPPTTIAGFERFIEWTSREQAAGRYVCFGIVPRGYDQVVGIIQVRQLDPTFATAEWGFALGAGFWGTGLLQASARAVLRFAFEELGVHRVEARAAVQNGRGNAALRKLGAVAEGVLRRSFLRDGVYHDQVLWGIVATEWNAPRPAPALPRVH